MDAVFASLVAGVPFNKRKPARKGAGATIQPIKPGLETPALTAAGTEDGPAKKKQKKAAGTTAATAVDTGGISLFGRSDPTNAGAVLMGQAAPPEVQTHDAVEEAAVLRKAYRIKISGSTAGGPLHDFEELQTRLGAGPRLLQNLKEHGFLVPTPIQRQAVPAMLEGHQLMAIAPTGSGKTLAFLLPIIIKLRNMRRQAATPTGTAEPITHQPNATRDNSQLDEPEGKPAKGPPAKEPPAEKGSKTAAKAAKKQDAADGKAQPDLRNGNPTDTSMPKAAGSDKGKGRHSSSHDGTNGSLEGSKKGRGQDIANGGLEDKKLGSSQGIEQGRSEGNQQSCSKDNTHSSSPWPEALKAIVLSPTHELAGQQFRVLQRVLPGSGLKANLLTAAAASGANFSKVDIVVANPLRLERLIEQKRVDCSQVRFLVLDEADKLFELGFLPQIDSILAACTHPDLTRALFSATLPDTVEQLARSVMHDPLRVTVGERNSAASSVKQRLLFVGREAGKMVALRQLVASGLHPPVLVFVSSKDRAHMLHKELMYDGVHVDSIHSDQPQAVRNAAVDNFRAGTTWLLVATDLVGRGMDFIGVNTVVNYDFPHSTTDYIHRVGRTGRGGRTGEAITFYTEADGPYVRAIANIMKASGAEVPDWMLQLPKTKDKRNKRRKLKQGGIEAGRKSEKEGKGKGEILGEGEDDDAVKNENGGAEGKKKVKEARLGKNGKSKVLGVKKGSVSRMKRFGGPKKLGNFKPKKKTKAKQNGGDE